MRKIELLIISISLIFIGLNGVVFAEEACEKLIPVSLREAVLKKYPDYRIAESTDQLSQEPDWSKYKEGKCLTVASGDFDGDTIKDFGFFLVDRTSKAPKLIAALSRGKQWSIKELPIGIKHIEGSYVEIIKPGTYKHAKSYKYKQSNANERKEITTKNASIVAGIVESTGVVYVYKKGQWLYVRAFD